MSLTNRNHVFRTLRKKYPVLIYESHHISQSPDGLRISFAFNLSGKVTFRPSLFIPSPVHGFSPVNEETLENLVFHIGMIELISYWKSACPPLVKIKPFSLTEKQVLFWKKLWYYGLGEFFYTNGIDAGMSDFLELSREGAHPVKPFKYSPSQKIMVPVGGGKDSVVTLELLKQSHQRVVPFIMNPRPASMNSAKQAGFGEGEVLIVKRTLDNQLLALNKKGYLNGHTPFSALLAFVTLLVARLTGIGNIALSNESSANEPTIPGTRINHQYSKSVEFESDFRSYVAEFVSPDFNYFSFLRPLNELQIAKLFSKFPHHYKTFRSCNVGSKTDVWCGKCPKCLFTRIIMGPFIAAETMVQIFGREILDDPGLVKIFDELTGKADEKPFECVGTVNEVNVALAMMVAKAEAGSLPYLLKYYKEQNMPGAGDPGALTGHFNQNHFLSGALEKLIRGSLT